MLFVTHTWFKCKIFPIYFEVRALYDVNTGMRKDILYLWPQAPLDVLLITSLEKPFIYWITFYLSNFKNISIIFRIFTDFTDKGVLASRVVVLITTLSLRFDVSNCCHNTVSTQMFQSTGS